tara:strand:+ start:241 stop:492 length:252 start_codon:yes stop_codon:yes gene_type:complete
MTQVVQIALLESPMTLEVLKVLLVKTVQQDRSVTLQACHAKTVKQDSTNLVMVKLHARRTAVLGRTFLQTKLSVCHAVQESGQ